MYHHSPPRASNSPFRPHHLQSTMRRPSDKLRFPNRRLRSRLLLLLLPLLLLSLLTSSLALRQANALGRRCFLPVPSTPPPAFSSTIAMVSFSDGGGGKRRSFGGLMDVVRANKETYARRWGYRFVDAKEVVDPARPASWSKILAVRRWLGSFDWVFWNDADSLVTNPDISLEGVLQALIGNSGSESLPDLIVSEDANGINAGMFFLRRSRWSEAFLDLWWNQTSFIQHGSTRSGDNAALIYLIKSMAPEEKGRHVHISSMQCAFNSYPWSPTWKSVLRLITSPATSWKGAYSPGDFMVHLAGLDDKVGWARKILQEIIEPATSPK